MRCAVYAGVGKYSVARSFAVRETDHSGEVTAAVVPVPVPVPAPGGVAGRSSAGSSRPAPARGTWVLTGQQGVWFTSERDSAWEANERAAVTQIIFPHCYYQAVQSCFPEGQNIAFHVVR